MNEIEKIKEILVSFLTLMRDDSTNSYTRGVLLDLVRQVKELNQPEPKQGYQGLNKWYVLGINTNNLDYIGFVTKINENKYVNEAIECEYYYCDEHYVSAEGLFNKIKRLATPEEIKQAILKGCEQHGIVEGAMVKCLKSGETHKIILNHHDFLDYEKNKYWAYNKEQTNFNTLIFDNGKFAEVVKEENIKCIHPYASATNICLICGGEMEEEPTNECTCKSVPEFNNCIKVCDRLELLDNVNTDKKLLKECLGLISYYQINYFQQNSKKANVQTEYLLTKLNKHLNHD